MEHSTRSLTTKLRREIADMPAQMQIAAKYIIDHPAEFGLNPIRITARNVGISTNVLIRLAQRLGFDSFDALRRPFRQTLITDHESQLGQDWLDHLRRKGDFDATHADLARNELNIISRSLRLAEPTRIRQAISLFTSAHRCFVTATRASYALAYYFHYAGRMAQPNLHLVPRHMGSAVDDLLDCDENDCLFAITVKPYSAETIRSMRFAQQRGARLVLLSDSETIAPGIDPDVTLPVTIQTQHPFSSFSGAMAVLECLLGHLFAAGGAEAQDRIAQYQHIREETGAYWKPSKLPRIRTKE